jgi:hypothetical protein
MTTATTFRAWGRCSWFAVSRLPDTGSCQTRAENVLEFFTIRPEVLFNETDYGEMRDVN